MKKLIFIGLLIFFIIIIYMKILNSDRHPPKDEVINNQSQTYDDKINDSRSRSKLINIKKETRDKLDTKIYHEKINLNDRISFVKKNLEKTFPEIEFDIGTKDCPVNFSKSNIWNSDVDEFDSVCDKTSNIENTSFDFSTYQKFLNGVLVEYSQSLEAKEPISMSFQRDGQLNEIFLYIEGVVVFQVEFEDNLVKNYHNSDISDEDIRFSSVRQRKEYLKKHEVRYTYLKNEKKKLENFLILLCQKFEHPKTCDASTELKNKPYLRRSFVD